MDDRLTETKINEMKTAPTDPPESKCFVSYIAASLGVWQHSFALRLRHFYLHGKSAKSSCRELLIASKIATTYSSHTQDGDVDQISLHTNPLAKHWTYRLLCINSNLIGSLHITLWEMSVCVRFWHSITVRHIKVTCCLRLHLNHRSIYRKKRRQKRKWLKPLSTKKPIKILRQIFKCFERPQLFQTCAIISDVNRVKRG